MFACYILTQFVDVIIKRMGMNVKHFVMELKIIQRAFANE